MHPLWLAPFQQIATNVTTRIPDYLKLISEEVELPREAAAVLPRSWTQLAAAFEAAVGWRLNYEAVAHPRAGEPSGHLVVSPPEDTTRNRVVRRAAQGLASSLGQWLEEWQFVQRTITNREAELAAGVPVVSHPQESAHLALRLQAVLRGGAEAIGAESAALYLLDDSTNSLKMRSAWGLPWQRLMEPARPLAGAVADLEALTGHAVVIDDDTHGPWQAPETCGAALCVPVATPTVPLGTLWMFAPEPRDFSPAEVQLIEIVAGRLAAELERDMLISHAALQWNMPGGDELANWHSGRTPRMAPLVDDWQIAGCTGPAGRPLRHFHDWFVLPDGGVSFAVGSAGGRGPRAALTASSLQMALRAHTSYRHEPGELIERINDSLWTSSAGDELGSLLYGVVQPSCGALALSVAGQPQAVVLGAAGHGHLPLEGPLLGMEPELRFAELKRQMQPREVLIAVEGAPRAALAALAPTLAAAHNATADELLTLLREKLLPENHAGEAAMVVVRRLR